MVYTFGYNPFGNRESVSAGENKIARYLYDENGIEARRHTVAAATERLMKFSTDIVCVRSTQNRYFIADRVLELPELKSLVDAVDAARFISVKRSRAISRKLIALTGEHRAQELHRNFFVEKRPGS